MTKELDLTGIEELDPAVKAAKANINKCDECIKTEIPQDRSINDPRHDSVFSRCSSSVQT